MKLRAKVLDAVTVVTALAALSVAYMAIHDRHSRQGPRARQVEDWASLLEGGHVKGPEDARLTIVEFGDYECPACQSVESTLRDFAADHAGEVSIVYRHWPLAQHPRAYPAARAAECAGRQGKFWPFHEGLYSSRDLSDSTFLALAEDVVVPDPRAFAECIVDEGPVPAIETDIEAVLALESFGTPTLIANGRMLAVIPSRDDLEALLEDAR